MEISNAELTAMVENLVDEHICRFLNELFRNKAQTPPFQAKKVYQFNTDGELLASYRSHKEAERKTGVNHVDISRFLQGKRTIKQAGGFIWSESPKVKI